MEREKILQQIMSLPEKSRFLVGYNEMAKDLSEVMEDNEVIEGVVEAYEKSISHVMKNGRIMRSFMAITDKNIYVLSRGRKIYNNLSMLEKTIVIPRMTLVSVKRKEIPSILKIWYEAELEIVTTKNNYEIYMGPNYDKYLPKDFWEKIGTNRNKGEGMEQQYKCCICGYVNAVEALYCKQCGSQIQKNRINEEKSVCKNCGHRIKQNTKFCSNCGMPVALETESVCSHCGKRVLVNAKFCSNCGKILRKSR